MEQECPEHYSVEGVGAWQAVRDVFAVNIDQRE